MNIEKKLYQWDTEQKLTGCTGLYVDFPIGNEVYRVETADGTCIIPDELLQTSGSHKVYECMTNNTIRSFAFSVTPRPKPPDYVYTPTERLTFEGLVQRVDDAVADMIRRAESGEFDGHTPVKGTDYFTTGEIQQIQNEVSSGAIGEFKSVVDTETETFNTNAESKLITYNENDVAKIGAYNTNASDKLDDYNTNASNKVTEYNSNAENKTAEFDTHTEQIQADISELKSDLNEFKEGTFDKLDYGSMITAKDCSAQKGTTGITDTDNGILLNKTERLNDAIYFYFNDLPIARAANPVQYDFSITFDDTTGIDEVYFYDGSTQVGLFSGGTIEKQGNTYKFHYEYKNQSKLRWQIALSYSFQSTKTVTNISGTVSGVSPQRIKPDAIEWYLKERDGIGYDKYTPLKIEETLDGQWEQGVCSVGDNYIGFHAQTETVNGGAYIGSFNDFSNPTRVNHELGHCNSADYNKDLDTMITADVNTVYFVKDMVSVVSNKRDMLLADKNVVTVLMEGLGGEGFSGSCFGECKNIVYLIRNESHDYYMAQPMKYIYKCFIGLGSNNVYSLFASDNYGTFVENCGENEFNGTLHILKKYSIELPTEVQDVKYVGTCLAISTDTRINGILSSYITCISLDDVATVKETLWIPTYFDDGTLRNAECGGMCLHGEFAYVAVSLKNPTVIKTFKFRNSVLF